MISTCHPSSSTLPRISVPVNAMDAQMGQVMEITVRPYMKSPAEIFLARGGSGGGGGVPGECLISCQVAADALRPSYMVTTRYLQIQS